MEDKTAAAHTPLRPYEPPVIVSLGTVAELTRALASGPNLDFDAFSPSLP